MSLMISIANSWRKMPNPKRYFFVAWVLVTTTDFLHAIIHRQFSTPCKLHMMKHLKWRNQKLRWFRGTLSHSPWKTLNQSTIWLLFSIIINKLRSLGKIFTFEELVREVLRILFASWESKVTALKKVKELSTITLDELVGNLRTYEMRRNWYKSICQTIQEVFDKYKETGKREAPRKPKALKRTNFNDCYKYGKLDHIVSDCLQ